MPSSAPVSSRVFASGSAARHQGAADQHRVDADPLQLLQLGARRRCRSRRRRSCRPARRASARRWSRRRRCRSSRLRLLIPITSASSSSARSQLLARRGPRPGSRGRAPRASSYSARSVVVVEGADDQQHRVGAVDRRLVELVGVDDEVLAQDRQVAGGAGGAQVLERAAEVALVGEHRERRRAAALVGADLLGDVGRRRRSRRRSASAA